MSSFQRISSITGLSSFQSIPPDVTPNSVNWGNLDWNAGMDATPNNSAQITGIGTNIQIRLSSSPNGIVFDSPVAYYKKSASAIGATNYFSSPGTWTALTLTGSMGSYTSNTISVSNNEYVGFVFIGATDMALYTITVQNTSDGNAALDTFTSSNYT